MPYFEIDMETNNITVLGRQPEMTRQTVFASESDLRNMFQEWQPPRIVELWNSFAGVAPFDDLRPVKKFENRGAAAKRIWVAVQRLVDGDSSPDESVPIAEQDDVGQDQDVDAVATPETTDGTIATTSEEEPGTMPTAKPQKATKRATKPAVAKPAKVAKAKSAPVSRNSDAGSKRDIAVALLSRKKGVTLAELMTAMSWQAHSVRGFLSNLQSKHGMKIESTKRDGERWYQAVA